MKKLAAIIVAVCMVAGLSTSVFAADETHNVGMTITSLANVTWSAQVEEIQKELDEMGWGFSCVVHNEDPSTANTQIENFVSSGCDIIIINGCASGGIEDSLAAAQAAGVKVVADGHPIEGVDADALYMNDNYDAGFLGGVALGEWFNEVYGEDHKAIIGAMTYESIELIRMGRTQGQIDGLESVHPNYEVVAFADVFNEAETMNETENMLSAHPDIEAILNWGDSMALSCLEAARGQNVDEEKFAIISIDGTKEAVEAIAKPSAFIQSTSLGGPTEQGADMVKVLKDLVAGEVQDVYYSPNLSITRANCQEFLAGAETEAE